MQINEMQNKIKFNIGEALNTFRKFYPELNPIPVEVSENGRLIVSVEGGGFHAVNEHTCTQWYETIEEAREDNRW